MLWDWGRFGVEGCEFSSGFLRCQRAVDRRLTLGGMGAFRVEGVVAEDETVGNGEAGGGVGGVRPMQRSVAPAVRLGRTCDF